jgi:hypothetical protein
LFLEGAGKLGGAQGDTVTQLKEFLSSKQDTRVPEVAGSPLSMADYFQPMA